MLEELGGGSGAEGVREGELDEGVGGGGGDVEGVHDGGEVGGGEVEGIDLVEKGLAFDSQRQGKTGRITYPGIAYPVVEEGLVCFVADVGGLVELGTVVGCVFEYLCR